MWRVLIGGEGHLEDGWEDKLEKYVSERGVRGNGLKWARRECMDSERWRSVNSGHHLGDAFGGSEASELLMLNMRFKNV